MSIGLIGVSLSLILGIILGGISGYYGGAHRQRDPARDRVPALDPDDPALDGPRRGDARIDWPPVQVYFVDHHHPVADRLDRARARGARPVPVRCETEDFVTAARLDGASEMRHHLPAHGALVR